MIFLFDTETVGLAPFNFIYDIAWILTDRRGNIKCRRNFLIKDVITDPKKMMSAFYAKKIFSWYIPALDANEINLVPLQDVIEIMYNDLTECDTIAAYNIGFDLSAIKNTVDVCNNQDTIIFDDFKILCLWAFSCKVLLPFNSYRNYAIQKGWLSKAGNIKTTAETTYRYITKDSNFIEDHTALSDCMIENEIMTRCFARKKEIPYNMINCAPWRWVQTPEQIAAMNATRRIKQIEMFT